MRLTALWALAESGLGGVLFALKLPFTGFLIGAVSVIILSFIARLSGNSARQLLGATVLVLLVKAGASPHSPPAAYLAVAFQGVLAAVLFPVIRSPLPAAVLLGAITMAESAGQKLILLTLVFGTAFWDAVAQFAGSIAKIFGRQSFEGSALAIGSIYLALYAVWGIVVGVVAARLPLQLEREREPALAAYRNARTGVYVAGMPPARRQKKHGMALLLFGAVLACIVLLLHVSGKSGPALLLLFGRSIAVLFLLFFVLRPLLQYFLNRWLQRRATQRQAQIKEIMAFFPTLKAHVGYAWKKGAALPLRRRVSCFMRITLILTLYGDAR